MSIVENYSRENDYRTGRKTSSVAERKGLSRMQAGI